MTGYYSSESKFCQEQQYFNVSFYRVTCYVYTVHASVMYILLWCIINHRYYKLCVLLECFVYYYVKGKPHTI